MRIHVSVQTNHFFGNTNTQKTVATEKKPSHGRKAVFCVFVYWCIGAKKSQPYCTICNTIEREALHFFVEFVFCVRLFCQEEMRFCQKNKMKHSN